MAPPSQDPKEGVAQRAMPQSRAVQTASLSGIFSGPGESDLGRHQSANATHLWQSSNPTLRGRDD